MARTIEGLTHSGRARPKAGFDIDENGCWAWRGGLSQNGYGIVCIGGRSLMAHRVAYEMVVGVIPEGMELDHLCRVRNCVNPAHLEPVTHRENVLRGVSFMAHRAMSTECLRGHAFSSENTSVRPNGARVCLACQRERYRKWYDKHQRVRG